MKNNITFILFSVSIVVVILLLNYIKLSKESLDMAYRAHAETLEFMIAAKMALSDRKDEARIRASNYLDEARAVSALHFAENKIFHKDILFIIEFEDEQFAESPYLNGKERQTIKNYLEKSRE